MLRFGETKVANKNFMEQKNPYKFGMFTLII